MSVFMGNYEDFKKRGGEYVDRRGFHRLPASPHSDILREGFRRRLITIRVLGIVSISTGVAKAAGHVPLERR
jgi:hypothetical protein